MSAEVAPESATVDGVAVPDLSLALRQRASRDEVLAAAAEAFIERGYAATSIDDVAHRLGCTKGRVYHYFRTKGELYLGVHRRALEISVATVAPLLRDDGDAAGRLHSMAEAHARLMVEQSGFMRLAVQHAEMSLAMEGRTPRQALLDVSALRQEYEGLFERVIAEGVAGGEFREVPPNLMAKAALGALNWIGVWNRPEARRRSSASVEIAEEFADFVLAGLLAPQLAPRQAPRS